MLPFRLFVTQSLLLVVFVGCSRSQGDTTGALRTDDGVKYKVERVAENLEIPWSIAFHDGDLYFTERRGRIKKLENGTGTPLQIAELRNVRAVGEGGLMGLAFHPLFNANRFVYLSYTYESPAGTVYNRVSRFALRENGLHDEQSIVDRLPGASIHNGCRIHFGPDGKLYISTGDAANRANAQMLTSLAGKMLRVNDDGTIPADNPFTGSPVYSLGHRNSQGFEWQPSTGMLVEAEHGPSGFDGPGGGDEINIIRPGKNYGWPTIHHQQTAIGMQAPLLEFTPAIAPSGACFYSGDQFPGFQNDLFVATLRGKHILRIIFDPANPEKVVRSERLLEGAYGRLRDITVGPDGCIYVATSNKDNRANPSVKDDRILRLVPTK